MGPASPLASHSSSNPSGRSTSTVRADASWWVTKRTGMSTPDSSTRRSLAGLASTAAIRPSSVPAASRTAAPTSSCTHMVPGASMGSASSSTPRRRSAAVRSATASNRTMKRSPPKGFDATTRSVPRAEASDDPGLSRCSWSVQSWTTTSPRRPWALVTRPTLSSSVVDDVHAGLDAVLGARHVDQRPDGLGRAPAAPDDPAHVVGGHVEAQPKRAPALLGVDDDCVRVVGQRPGQVGEHRERRAALGSGPLVALAHLVVELVDLSAVGLVDVARFVEVGHFALAAAKSSHAPEVFRRRSTRSVGCAPFTSHFTALALSIWMTASGSAVEAPRGA